MYLSTALALLTAALAAGAAFVAGLSLRESKILRAELASYYRASKPAGTKNSHSPDARQVVVIFNPAKESAIAELRAAIASHTTLRALAEVEWIPTTVTEPGTTQARQAVAAGAQRIIVAGGDGTVRAVAAGVAHSGVPLGVIPRGTGNLFARNLGLPIGDLAELVSIAFSDSTTAVDLGWLQLGLGGAAGHAAACGRADAAANPADTCPQIDRPEVQLGTVDTAGAADKIADKIAAEDTDLDGALDEAPGTEVSPPAGDDSTAVVHPFLVMAGTGFDSELIAETDHRLKKTIGWGAYVVAALKLLRREGFTAQVRTAEHGLREYQKCSTLLVANCGRLPFKLEVVEKARIDDGVLDVTAVQITLGTLGWIEIAGKIVLRSLGLRRRLPGNLSAMQVMPTAAASVTTGAKNPVQADGDIIGQASCFSTWVEKHALQVCR